MLTVRLGQKRYSFNSIYEFKNFSSVLHLQLVEDQGKPPTELELDSLQNHILTPWAFDWLHRLHQLLLRSPPNTALPELKWMERFDHEEPRPDLSYSIPEFHETTDGRRFLKGLPRDYGQLFWSMEQHTLGPDQCLVNRGRNLKALFSLADFLGNHLAKMLCGARMAQHIRNSFRQGYTEKLLGGIIGSLEQFKQFRQREESVPTVGDSPPHSGSKKVKLS